MQPLAHLFAARPVLAAFAAMGALWGTFAAVLPDIKTQLGLNEAELGFLMLLTPLAAVSAMLVAPALGAAMGRVALPVAAALMALSFALPAQFHQPMLFALVMMGCGAATGLTDVLMNARTATLENSRQVSLMNLAHAAYSFGYFAGAMATGAMRSAAWPPAQVMATSALMAGLLALVTYERDGTIHGLTKAKGTRHTPLGAIPLIGGGIVLIAFLTENAAENWSALHIEQTFGGTPAQGAMGPAIMALTMGAARLMGQGLVQHINGIRLLIGGAVVAACGALLVAGAPSPQLAYAGFVVMGIGASVIAPTAFSLTGKFAPPDQRARAVARATLLGYFGYFVGPPMLGIIAGSLGLRAAFAIAALMLVGVLILAPLMARAQKR